MSWRHMPLFVEVSGRLVAAPAVHEVAIAASRYALWAMPLESDLIVVHTVADRNAMRRLDKLLVRIMLQWKRLLLRAQWFQVLQERLCHITCLVDPVYPKLKTESDFEHEQHVAQCRVRNHVSTSYVRSSFLGWAQVMHYASFHTRLRLRACRVRECDSRKAQSESGLPKAIITNCIT